MNMRQHKRLVQSKLMYSIVLAGLFNDCRGGLGFGQSTWVGHQDPELTKFADSISNDTMSLGDLFREAAGIEAAKVEFVCVKVKDGSVVDTFDTREAAQELVDKHVRGKKAKLEILETA